MAVSFVSKCCCGSVFFGFCELVEVDCLELLVDFVLLFELFFHVGEDFPDEPGEK